MNNDKHRGEVGWRPLDYYEDGESRQQVWREWDRTDWAVAIFSAALLILSAGSAIYLFGGWQ
jgi:hypothetical protein